MTMVAFINHQAVSGHAPSTGLLDAYSYSFLQELLDKGHTPSTLKLYVEAIAVNHSLVAGLSVVRNDLVVKFLRGARRLNPPRPSYCADLGLIYSPQGNKGPSL